MLKPLKRSGIAAAAAAATSVSFAQMLFLKASYASPPDALGPRAGVERPVGDESEQHPPQTARPVAVASASTPAAASGPSAKRAAAAVGNGPDRSFVEAESAAAAAAAAAAVVEKCGVEAVALNKASVSSPGKKTAAGRVQKNGPLQPQEISSVISVAESMSDVEAIVASMSRDATAAAEDAGTDVERKKPRILVIGDSLVSGVGGEASYSTGSRSGPPLPRYIARCLSEKWNADVRWNTMSLTGGDVRMLSRKILPMLRRERAEREAGGTEGPFTAVVLVTGVNDWKRMSPFRTPQKFRRDLAEFIRKIRAEVGDDDCHVFLPAIPGVHHAPRFHYPLRSFLIFINDLWDAQKVALARAMRNVHFVGNPPEADWTSEPAKFFCKQDRLHPSELGYTRWGERIAAQIAIATEKGRAALLNARVSGRMSGKITSLNPSAVNGGATASVASAASASAIRASSVASG